MANTAFDHSPTITVPSPTVNNRVVTWNGTTGKVFHNAATVTIAAGVVAGVTALTVDNLTIDGNTITSTDTNGNITLTPDGSGSVVMDTMTFNGNLLDVRNNGTASAIRLYCETNNLHYQEIKAAPHSIAANYTIVLPGAAPTAAGKVLKSSGSSPFSTLEWGDAGGGTSVAGTTDNGILTFVNSGSTFAAEANLLFDGTLLRIGSAASSTSASFLEITGTMPTHGSIGHVVIQSTDSMAADKGGELLLGGVYTGSSRAAMGGIGAFKENGTDGNYAGYLSLYSRTHGSSVAASEGIRIGSGGAVTMPKQPCLLYFNTTHQENKTGNGAEPTLTFGTEIYDQGSNFTNSTTFTAPVDGRYLVSVGTRWSGSTTNMGNIDKFTVYINAANRDTLISGWGGSAGSQGAGMSGSAVVDMDAGDALTISALATGTGGNNLTFLGGGVSAGESFLSVVMVA